MKGKESTVTVIYMHGFHVITVPDSGVIKNGRALISDSGIVVWSIIRTFYQELQFDFG